MTGVPRAVALELSVIRRNSLSPSVLDCFVDPDSMASLGVLRYRRASVIKRIGELCDRIHDAVPGKDTSAERGRLLRARRTLYAFRGDDTAAVHRALASLEREPELADVVTDVRDEIAELITAYRDVRDSVVRHTEELAHHATEVLRTEPLASTLAVSSPAFTSALLRAPIPADVDDRAFRTATSFLKRAAMKTSPFGRFTDVGFVTSDRCEPVGPTRVLQPRTLSTRLLFAAVADLEIDSAAVVMNSIIDTDSGKDWIVCAYRSVVDGVAVRFEEIGPRDAVIGQPDSAADAVALGYAVPALTFGDGDGPEDLRAIADHLRAHARGGNRLDTWIEVLESTSRMVRAMSDADAARRCAVQRRFDSQIRRVLPDHTGTRFFEAPGGHTARPGPQPAIVDAVGELAANAIVFDAEYCSLAEFLVRLSVRNCDGRRGGIRLDTALAAYLDAFGHARARRTMSVERWKSRPRETANHTAPTLASPITTTFIQTQGEDFVVNGLHTSGIGLIARHADRTSTTSTTSALSEFVRSAAPDTVTHQFTCWDDWSSMQSVGLADLPAVRLPGDLTGPADPRRPLSDFVVSVCPDGTIDARTADDQTPVSFIYTGVMPYPMLSGIPRLLALISSPWLCRREAAARVRGEVVRERTTPIRPTDDLVRPDPVDTALATMDWLTDSGVDREFFAQVVSVDGTRSKPQWYSQDSPTCLRELARLVDAPTSAAVDIVECFPRRTAEPVAEHVLAHRIEGVR